MSCIGGRQGSAITLPGRFHFSTNLFEIPHTSPSRSRLFGQQTLLASAAYGARLPRGKSHDTRRRDGIPLDATPEQFILFIVVKCLTADEPENGRSSFSSLIS